ncbi:MAG TPA: peroxiredoxin [Tepidiformaceae bacterium]|nr:peroxiredoxin [Tepidiformaceae bacterium]
MSLRLGDPAPDFTQESTEGPIHFNEWKGDSWAILFSHPADFTPVCTTELGMVAKLKPEFDRRNVKPIGLSVDPLDSHVKWVGDIAETQGTALNYPLLADADHTDATLYDMLEGGEGATSTVRSVFVIDPAGKLRLTLTYPASTGRNFDEILRVIDSLQLTDKFKVATPVNWQAGNDCVVLPTIKNEDAATLFPKGFTEVKPYLRMTPDPSK